MLQEWAKHTGRYREGIDKVEYVQWKTRLRCALNKARDFQFVAAESDARKESLDPFRVYTVKKNSSYIGE